MKKPISTVWLAAFPVAILAVSLSSCKSDNQEIRPSMAKALNAEGLNRPLVPGERKWVHLLSADEVARYYPEGAMRRGVPGSAVVRCHVVPDGSLHSCQIVSEQPAGESFGAATIAVVEQFSIQSGPYGEKTTLDVPMKWRQR